MARGSDTKNKLERAALTLFVARGVAETTTREIAFAAGIAEGTIYRHFASKEQLATELFLRHHTALARALDQAHKPHKGLAAKTRAIIAAWCASADADWLLFSYHLLHQHAHLINVKEDTPNPVAVIKSVIEAAMKNGETPKREADIVTAMVMGVVLQPAIHKIYGRIEGRLSDRLDLFVEAACKVLSLRK